ncbi:MAG TPA: AraC family transcriptional regulator [Phycisphaerales bacterium]|nr:AraC family transcriptional regulator [Phycisphaerales bacterium]HRQ75100.1 AraC family transcriptional regulator [Phycisphaerales bacterium]
MPKHEPSHAMMSQLSKAQLSLVSMYIQRDIAKRLLVRELADLVGMSASCFARVFKNSTGQTPHAYILQLRVQRAAEIIAQGQAYSLAQVAIQSGFSDQAHLTRAFRRLMKQTPAQFCRSRLMNNA